MSANKHWVQEALELYEPALMRYVLKLTGDVERSQDVLQESFLRLCRQDRDEITVSLKAWLFRVCRNLVIDSWRKDSRMTTSSELPQLSVSYKRPEEDLQKKESITELMKALSEIPGKQREVIRLKFQEEFSYKEIAKITGHSSSYVGVLVHTGLKTLRGQLSGSLLNQEWQNEM
jgi:RNA polymerase sigma factor (sigma-70 family)